MPAGHIQLFMVGEVGEFDEVPIHFDSLEAAPINFVTASEDEMLEGKWSYKEAATAMQQAYGVDLKKGGKASLVSQILDIRFRNEVKQA